MDGSKDFGFRQGPAYHAAGLRMAEVNGVEHEIILGHIGIMQKKTETIRDYRDYVGVISGLYNSCGGCYLEAHGT